MTAGIGIGAGANAIDVEVVNLSALATSGGIFIGETNAVTVDTVTTSVNRVSADATTASVDDTQEDLTTSDDGAIVLDAGTSILVERGHGDEPWRG